MLTAKQMRDAEIEFARRSLLGFTQYTMPTFEPNWFHRAYYGYLNAFARGEIKKLAIFVPPQHGKSEGSTRRLPAYLLGKDPNLKVAIVSYSSTKSRKFNREIQRIISSAEYAEVFPETKLNSSNIVSVAGEWLRNSEEFEIVDYRGSLKAVGVGGPLTGDPVDVLIMDDLYKDAMSAWSDTIRENVRDWYDTVATTRLHNDSRQLMVFTRWHHDDLGGTEATVENGWTVLKYPALKMSSASSYDPREQGEALWPEKHARAELERRQAKNPLVFSALYQQEPTPSTGTIFNEQWFTIIADEEWPLDIESYGTDWDLAYTKEEQNSASAFVRAGRIEHDIYIEDCDFKWLEFPDLIKWMKSTRGPHYIEGKASGKSARQTLNAEGVSAIEVAKDTDKITSARLIAPVCEAGHVYVRASIAQKLFHDERQGLIRFPGGTNSDMVDAFVQSINRLKSDRAWDDLDLLPTSHDTQWSHMI